MRKMLLCIIFTLSMLLNSASFVMADSGAGAPPATDTTLIYGGIIAILLAIVGIAIYVVYTYLKK